MVKQLSKDMCVCVFLSKIFHEYTDEVFKVSCGEVISKLRYLISCKIDLPNHSHERTPLSTVKHGCKCTTKMLGIMNLHNGMLLSTLSISSRGFAFGFPKKSRTN